MITIAVPAEQDGEPRVALSPDTAKKFSALGCQLVVEKGAGKRSHFSDSDFEDAGAKISDSVSDMLGTADILLKVRRPSSREIAALKSSAIILAQLDPFSERAGLEAIAREGLTSFSMEFMPRISRAQSMDVLSSQSNLAGYKAVINAAAHLSQAMPMMMTAAGTVPASRTFVMGVGVAGLQAIATARRLGAIVTATDVRPATKEQVTSLGAKFIAIEDEEFKAAETDAGYAKAMSDEYKKKQADLVAGHVKNQHVIVTTALIPGRPAPKLISKEMVESMPSGAVIVDLASERGGNCELTKPGEIIDHQGVTIISTLNLAGELAVNASSLYARNLYAFLEPQIDKETGGLNLNWEDETVINTVLTRGGKIVHSALRSEGDEK